MMSEAQVRAICTAEDVSKYTRAECTEADRWVRDYTLEEFRQHLRRCIMSDVLRKWNYAMASHTYGSAETDELLTRLRCYPKWLIEHNEIPE